MGRRIPFIWNKKLVHKLYIENQLSTCRVGILCKCSSTSVKNALKRYKIPVRPPLERYKSYAAGVNHRCWKGDKASYESIHQYMRKRIKKPSRCEHCHKLNSRLDLSNKSHQYSRDINDWECLCQSCHRLKEIKDGIRSEHYGIPRKIFPRIRGWNYRNQKVTMAS